MRVGIGDDCAVLRVPRGHELAVTTDMLLETVHFGRDWHSPESAGHRCLARGLSDLAAVGAIPLAAFLSFAVPPELAGRWTTRFLDGLLRLAREHRVPLAGGDTAKAPSVPNDLEAGLGGGKALFSADIVLLGSLPEGSALLRSGARAGDRLYVTGALGGAAAELEAVRARSAGFQRMRVAVGEHPQLFPAPRVRQGMRLRGLATAAIDISDGLSTDLQHLCESSRLEAEVEEARLPVHPFAQVLGGARALELALHGGEDYEILFTAAPGTAVPRRIAGVPVTEIGRMCRAGAGGTRVVLLKADGSRERLRPRGWEHFRSKPAAEQEMPQKGQKREPKNRPKRVG